MTAEVKPKKSGKGSAKARKTAARMAAVQVLYQMKLNNQDGLSTVREYMRHRSGKPIDGDQMVVADQELLENIVLGIERRWTDIEEIVAGALAIGKKGEVEPLLDAILRAGAYELLAHEDTDTGIIINDYMNVTAGFYEGTETKLVNAVLDGIGKKVRG